MANRELTRRTRGQEIAPTGGWSPFEQLRREMDRLFESFPRFGLGTSELPEVSAAMVPVDVEESGDKVKLHAELPGVTEKDIELSLDPSGDLLLLKGEKKVEHESEEGGVYRAERSYGRFERTIPLPAPVKEDQIQAQFKNGVLTVEMTKTDQGKSRKKIPIKGS